MYDTIEKNLWKLYTKGASDFATGIIRGFNKVIEIQGNCEMNLTDVVRILESSKKAFIENTERNQQRGDKAAWNDTWVDVSINTPIYITDEFDNVYVGTMTMTAGKYGPQRGKCIHGDPELFYRNKLAAWALIESNQKDGGGD